jgi:MFS family permease
MSVWLYYWSAFHIPTLGNLRALHSYNLFNVIFTVYTWRCAYVDSFHNLVVWRFLAGLGGGAAFALAPSSTTDLLAVNKRGVLMLLVDLAHMLGPATDPVAGSYTNAT